MSDTPQGMYILTKGGRDMTVGKFMVKWIFYRTAVPVHRVVRACLYATAILTAVVSVVGIILGMSGWADWSPYILIVSYGNLCMVRRFRRETPMTLRWVAKGQDVITTRLWVQPICTALVGLVVLMLTPPGRGWPVGLCLLLVSFILFQVALYGATIVDSRAKKKRRSWSDAKAKLKAKIPRIHVRIPIPAPA